MSATAMHMEASRTRFELDSDSPDDVTLDDVVYGLVHTSRFNGHTSRPVCVAEHSLRVEKLLERQGAHPLVRMHGLLHDAAEAYVGDIPTPVKKMIGPRLRHLESRIFYRIWRALVDPDAKPQDIFEPAVIHAADREAFYIEASVVCTGLEPWDEESACMLPWARDYVRDDPKIMSRDQLPSGVRAAGFIHKYEQLLERIR